MSAQLIGSALGPIYIVSNGPGPCPFPTSLNTSEDARPQPVFNTHGREDVHLRNCQSFQFLGYIRGSGKPRLPRFSVTYWPDGQEERAQVTVQVVKLLSTARRLSSQPPFLRW